MVNAPRGRVQDLGFVLEFPKLLSPTLPARPYGQPAPPLTISHRGTEEEQNEIGNACRWSTRMFVA